MIKGVIALAVAGALGAGGFVAADTFAGGGPSTLTVTTTETADTETVETDTVEDRGARRRAGVRAREADEDVRGPCDEAEHANDPRCTGAAADRGGRGDDRDGDDRRGRGGRGDRDRGGDDDRGRDDDERGDDHGGRSGSNSGRG